MKLVPAQLELAAHVVKQSSRLFPALLARIAKSMVMPEYEISISKRKTTPLIVRIVLGEEGTGVEEPVLEEVRETEPVGREEVEFPAPVMPAERVELPVALRVELEPPTGPPEGVALPVAEAVVLAEDEAPGRLSTRAKSVPGVEVSVSLSMDE